MELLASQYDEGSAFADDQRRAHLANLAQLEALTSKEIETERSYFLEKDGEMLRRVYAGSAGKLAVWTSETLDAMRSEQVGWTESFATKRGRDEDDWLSITEQRRESVGVVDLALLLPH